jgi:acetyl/propionyl-CoA carboxylase alpha subunit
MDSGSLLRQIQDYDSRRKNSVDVLNEAMGKYGVPEIRKRVSGLRTTLSNTESALNAVDPSVTGRTQGSLVTEAQRQRQVANERAPIAEQYGQQARALSDESANLGEQLQAAQLLAQNQVSDYDRGRSALQAQYETQLAREAEERRRFEADRAFQLQQQQAEDARRAAAASLASPTFGGGSSGGASKPSTDPLQQRAYNAVRDLLNVKDKGVIINTFNAIQKSAGYGNAYDKIKLQLLQQMAPGLFGGRNMTQAVGNYNQLRF